MDEPKDRKVVTIEGGGMNAVIAATRSALAGDDIGDQRVRDQMVDPAIGRFSRRLRSRVPTTHTYVAHELRGSRAAKRRLRQMAEGKIDPRTMSESAKYVAPLLKVNDGDSQAIVEHVNAMAEKEVNAKPGTLRDSIVYRER